jgi:hypothetical protein
MKLILGIGTLLWVADTLALLLLVSTLIMISLLSLASDITFEEMTKGANWYLFGGMGIYWIAWTKVLLSDKVK